MKANQVLARNGICVPKVFGMLDDPHVFFMDWVDNDDRETGLLSQIAEGDRGGLPPERWEASLKYMDELARIHTLPISEFAETGVAFPASATELATGLFQPFYDMLGKRIEVPARLEFFRLWLVRNAPQHRARGSYVAGDACQFLSRGPDVVALLDFELGHIGDPLQDLACFRGRHPVENLGDIYALFRRYEEITGTLLDIEAIQYHTAQFLAAAITGVSIAVSEQHEYSNPTETMSQLCFSARRGFEAIAQLADYTLCDVPPPKPFRFPYADNAIVGLAKEIAHVPTSATLLNWQHEIMLKTPQFIANFLALGPWLVEEGLSDIERVTSQRYESWEGGDRGLRDYVQQAGADQDEALLQLFHRAAQRECSLIAGPNGSPNDLIFTKMEPMPRNL